MSGHSKFANIKHKKEKNDAAKGKIFTIIGREIAVAVKEGGPDPANNFKLAQVVAIGSGKGPDGKDIGMQRQTICLTIPLNVESRKLQEKAAMSITNTAPTKVTVQAEPLLL